MSEILNSAIVKVQNAKYAFSVSLQPMILGRTVHIKQASIYQNAQRHFCSTLRE